MSRIAANPPDGPLRLDVAIGRVLVEPVDAATRAELGTLQAAIHSRDVASEGLDPPSLVGAVFTFIMPHLSNPSVLRFERRRLLLERLEARAAAAAAADASPLVPGALIALRHELANLRLLQQNRDSLVEG